MKNTAKVVSDKESIRQISALLEGEEKAWHEFFERHQSLVHNAALKVLGHTYGAHVGDCVQAVFEKLCANDFHTLRLFDPTIGRLENWLAIITRNTALDIHRNLARQATTPAREENWVAAPDVNPDANIDKVLPNGLLSPAEEMVLHLVYDLDFTKSYSAKLMDVSASTVRVLHHRALRKLRTHYTGQKEELI